MRVQRFQGFGAVGVAVGVALTGSNTSPGFELSGIAGCRAAGNEGVSERAGAEGDEGASGAAGSLELGRVAGIGAEGIESCGVAVCGIDAAAEALGAAGAFAGACATAVDAASAPAVGGTIASITRSFSKNTANCP
jgi:hypothetical protein